MRRRLLIQSVLPHLPDDERLIGAVSVWTVSIRTMLGAAFGGLMTFITLGIVADIPIEATAAWSLLLAVSVGVLLTDSRVVALTDDGFVLLAGSPIRNVATKLISRLSDDAAPRKLGGNLAISDWTIDGRTYSVSKREEKELERLLAYSGSDADR